MGSAVSANFHYAEGFVKCHFPVEAVSGEVEEVAACIQIGVQVVAHLEGPVLTVGADDEGGVVFEPVPPGVQVQVSVEIGLVSCVLEPVQYPVFSADEVTAAFSCWPAGRHWTVQAGDAGLFGAVGGRPAPAVVGVPGVCGGEDGDPACLTRGRFYDKWNVEGGTVRVFQLSCVKRRGCSFGYIPREIGFPHATFPGEFGEWLKGPFQVMDSFQFLGSFSDSVESYIVRISGCGYFEFDGFAGAYGEFCGEALDEFHIWRRIKRGQARQAAGECAGDDAGFFFGGSLWGFWHLFPWVVCVGIAG